MVSATAIIPHCLWNERDLFPSHSRIGSRVFRTAPGPEYVEHVLILGLDAVARSYMEIEGLQYVDLATTMRRFMPVGTNLSEWSPDGRHYGSGAVYQNLDARVTVSTLLTQKVLADICQ